MKQINNVRNTIENGSGLTRLKSRIVSASSRVWLAFAPILLVVFGLFGVNENAWATWPTYEGTITQSGSTYYVVNDNNEHSLDASGSGQSLTYKMGGPGDELSMYARRTRPTAVGDLVVKSYNNDDEKDNVYQGNPAGTNYSVLKGYQGYGDLITRTLTTKAVNKLIFSAHLGSYSKQFKTVKVTMFSGVLQPKNAANNANITTWTYTAADYAAENSYKDFTVDWSNLASLPLSKAVNGSSDDRAQFSYEIYSNTQTLAKGKYGTATIRVKYKHDKVGTHSVKINVGDYSITFTGTTNKITPYIVTTPTVDTITYGQTISNSQLGTGLVKADLINAAGTVVPGTWTIDENGQIVTTSGGSNATVHLTFTPTDGNTYNTIHTTATMFVRSVATISWAEAYSATMPTIPVGKWITGAATTDAAGATITYSSTSENIEFNEDHTSFRATGAGEVEVVASHGNTPTHGAASDSKTFKATDKDIQVIVWADRFDRLTTEMTTKSLVAEVYVENPSTGVRTYSAERTALLEYTSNNSNVVSVSGTTLTIEGKGTTTLRAYVAGDDQYEEASVTMPVKVREPSEGCDDPLLLNETISGNNDYLLRINPTTLSTFTSDPYTIDISEGKKPNKLIFQYQGEFFKLVGNWKYLSGATKVEEQTGPGDNDWHEISNSSFDPSDDENWYTYTLQLSEEARAIRFVRPKDGTGYHRIRYVEVTQKEYIEVTPDTVDFGSSIKVNSTEYKDVKVKYSNVKDVLSVSKSSEYLTVNDQIDAECGAHDSTTLRITYHPVATGLLEDYVYIRDNKGNISASIYVTANPQRADQTITWNQSETILATEPIELNATTNGQEHGVMNYITYTVTNNDDVIARDGNTITILKPGTVTITATQNGSTNYEAADPVEKNFTISAETLTILEAPTASGNLTYGQTLSDVTVIGGSVQDSKGNTVAGSFSWQTATTAPNAGDNQNFTVVFTPEENAAWYNTLTTSVAVNVEKADATLSWTSAPTELAYNATGVVYTATSASNGTITYSITSGDSYAHIDANTGALTIDVPGKSITVQAMQAEGTNHNVPEAITVNVTIAAAPVNEFTNATGDGEWDTDDNWSTGTAPSTSEPDIIVAGQLVIDEVKTVGSMTIMPTGGVTIIEGGLLTVNKATPDQTGGYGDLRVAENGALKLNNVLQVRDFTLDAKLAGKNNSNVKEAAASGQVENQNQMTINGDAYFQMTFDPKGKISFGWYDFVVPFPVNISDGIFRGGDLENHLVSGVDFLIQEYSESRCSNKQNAWTNFSGTMQPGRVYTVTFNYDPDFDQNVFVFKKASGAMGAPTMFATQYSEGNGDTDDYGWNGLGNGMLQHGYITGTFAHMQVYNHAENKYDLLTGMNPTFAIGTSFFVQVDHTTPTMKWNAAAANEDHPLYAPKYDNIEVEEFMLSLRGEDQVDASDHFYISASEEATEAYVIGHDLRKMGTPTAAKTAQMWATKNGKKLCDIETRMANYKATSDLNFYAPQAQTYTLSVDEAPEDATLYLTYNGRVIWSLTASPYTIDLTQGMTEGYGLRIEARHNAPQVATGVDEVDVDQNGNRKVLIDNMLYILTPEGAMYSVTGEKVK